MRYLYSTSGMGLVLGGQGPVVLTGHADASWVDDSATQRSSQGYTFSLGATLAHPPADYPGRAASFASPNSSLVHSFSFILLTTGGADSRGTAGAGVTGGTAGGAGGAGGAGATSPRGATGAGGPGPTSPGGTAGAGGAGGATSAGGAGGATSAGGVGAGGNRGARAVGLGGAHTRGAGAAGAGGAVRARGATGDVGSGGTGGTACAGGAGAGGTGGTGDAGAAGPGGARSRGARAAGAGGAAGVGGAGGATGAAGTGGAGGTAGAGGAGARGTGGTGGAGAAVLGGVRTRGAGAAGAGGTAGAGGAGAGDTGGARASSPGGARTRGAGAAGEGGAAGDGGAGGATRAAGTGGAGGTAGTGGTGGAEATGAGDACDVGARGAGAAGYAPRRLFFYPQPQSPVSAIATAWLLAACSALHTEVTDSLTQRRELETHAPTPVRARGGARPCPPAVPGTHSMALRPSSVPQCVVLPEPCASSLPHIPDPDLQRPVFNLHQALREWHDTVRTTLADLGFASSSVVPSVFLHTDTALPPFHVLVYVGNLVFATAETEALALVKAELHERHTCTDLGELRSYLGLQISRDRARRTITLTQRFGLTWSSPQPTPLSTGHSLSAPPSDKFVEPSGPYPELVGCLMYLMTCTRPDLAYLLSLLARYVAPGQGLVVLSRHSDASWADDQVTQRSSQGYTFSLGPGFVLWRSTRSSSVLGSSCEAEIYAWAMAAQELRWLTYLLTDLGEWPCSPLVLYIDNKAMLALYQEQRLEQRTKHIALLYFLARELQQRCQLRLSYVASQANTANVFTKALGSGDHQRFCTALG
ncbi:unnamed protein product, partial [Closterium sp. NIES-54]